MKLLSYNIRGGGLSSKRERISFLIQSNMTKIGFLQETKITCFDDCMARSF